MHLFISLQNTPPPPSTMYQDYISKWSPPPPQFYACLHVQKQSTNKGKNCITKQSDHFCHITVIIKQSDDVTQLYHQTELCQSNTGDKLSWIDQYIHITCTRIIFRLCCVHYLRLWYKTCGSFAANSSRYLYTTAIFLQKVHRKKSILKISNFV